MVFLRVILAFAALVAVSACGSSSKFRTYDGPEVTRVLVYKERRELFLMNNDQVLSAHKFALGFAPVGHKEFEGDGRTPEGDYLIDTRNPNSRYHLSLRVSYPDADDIAAAVAAGRDPGGDIFLHGQPTYPLATEGDWTWGCIALSNEEIEMIYAMVEDGTVISIYP